VKKQSGHGTSTFNGSYVIYVTLFYLCSSEGLVLLQDITIEDLQKAKYCDGASKCTNPKCSNNPK
jgi:hypothetical protein